MNGLAALGSAAIVEARRIERRAIRYHVVAALVPDVGASAFVVPMRPIERAETNMYAPSEDAAVLVGQRKRFPHFNSPLCPNFDRALRRERNLRFRIEAEFRFPLFFEKLATPMGFDVAPRIASQGNFGESFACFPHPTPWDRDGLSGNLAPGLLAL